jgi:hypothetical protein
MSAGSYGEESTLTRSQVLNGRCYGIPAAGNGAEPEVVPLVVAEPARATCALPGCTAPLPPRRRRYCSTSHAEEAEHRRLRAPRRLGPRRRS